MAPESLLTGLPPEVELVAALGGSLNRWAHQCHAASLHLVKSGVFGDRFTRVARGGANVGRQHSWVVVGEDCYDHDAMIVDPTLWSYDESVRGIYVGRAKDRPHVPHGAGSIWAWGRPAPARGTAIELTPSKPFSTEAAEFLEVLGPLDLDGWSVLAAMAPVEYWPAGEIYEAMLDTPELAARVPIDRVGMLTLRNPDGLYLAPRAA